MVHHRCVSAPYQPALPKYSPAPELIQQNVLITLLVVEVVVAKQALGGEIVATAMAALQT
jgi:hypothetical protein